MTKKTTRTKGATTNGVEPQQSVTLSLIKNKRNKQDNGLLHSNVLDVEDGFQGMYYDPKTGKGDIIEPPINFYLFDYLVRHNNALGQLVSAMEVNIDGTGHEILPVDIESEGSKQAVSNIGDFFNEPYPARSFTSIRRPVRHDTESIGNGYIEVIRNGLDKLMFMKDVDGKTMRLCRLGEAVEARKTVIRNGKDITVRVLVRERKFVQIVGTTRVYFKEYGASRDLNKDTGEWAAAGQKFPAKIRASEILHFKALSDTTTPYGIPRWINQIPSVLGSRKAEELNLDFFNAGGLPPVLLLVNGGILGAEVRKNLEAYLSGEGSNINRAAIVEAQSTSGSIDKAGKVEVQVERFGSERQQDSMFEKYDEKCELRLRSSFRLAPIFVGRTDSYTFATAFASYTVAEAQVFNPERIKFDEVITVTIMKELDPDYKFRSLPLQVNDTIMQLKAIEIVAAKGLVEGKDVVKAVNQVTNLTMQFSGKKETTSTPSEGNITDQLEESAGPNLATPTRPPEQASRNKQDISFILELVSDWTSLSTGAKEYTEVEVSAMRGVIKTLDPVDVEIFNRVLAMNILPAYDTDSEGAAELCGCAADILN